MWKEQLPREKEITVNSFEKAKEFLRSDYKVEQIGVNLAEIEVDQDGWLSFSDYSFPMTDWSFESLCNILGIPVAFGRRISVDLLLYNINALKHVRNIRIVVLVARETVINIVRHPFVYTRNEALLDAMSDVVQKLNLNLHEVKLSDRTMDVKLLYQNDTLSMEPIPGDPSRIGVNICNSETGFGNAQAVFWVLRQICTNGAIANVKWGGVNMTYDPEISQERAIDNFMSGIQNLSINYKQFAEVYKRLVDHELNVNELMSVWRKVSRITGNDLADSILNINKKDRSAYLEKIRIDDSLTPTGRSAYQIYIGVTEAAKKFPYHVRQALEIIGGSMIDLPGDNKRSV